MKSKKLGLFLTLALVLTGTLAFAQDAAKEEESPIKLSGTSFFAYYLSAGSINKTASAASLVPNYFSLDRLYLNWDHQLGKHFAYHVTLDVLPSTAVGTASYVPFVQEAYTTANFGMDDLFTVYLNLGMIQTPIIKNRNKMMDLRWITSNMFDGHATLIGAQYYEPGTAAAAVNKVMADGDQSADLGLGIDFSVLKMITLTFAVTAGEGRKSVLLDQNAINSGKAIYLDLFVEPIKGLYVTGFWRDETGTFINSIEPTVNSSTKVHKWFAGGGAVFNMMGIRAGADFEIGQNVTESDSAVQAQLIGTSGFVTKNFYLINVYLNWNLQEIASFPLLVIAKMTYGTYTDWSVAAPNGGNTLGRQYDSVNWMVGLGWQFNKNFRLAIMFEQTYFSDAEIYMNGAYQPGSVAGGNPYNTDALALAKGTTLTNGAVGWNNANSKIMFKTETKF